MPPGGARKLGQPTRLKDGAAPQGVVVTDRQPGGPTPWLWLSAAGERRLHTRLHAAAMRLKGSETRLVSVSEPLGFEVDPSAVVLASREADEPWSALEQPDRERAAVATLGAATVLTAHGPHRFAELDRIWRDLSAHAVCDAGGSVSGAGLIAVAGFAFAHDGATSEAWEGFGAASLVVPQVSLARSGARTWLTCTVLASAGDDTEALIAVLRARMARIVSQPLPPVDPAPSGRFIVRSPIPPAQYEYAVARAVELIGSGEMQKIVLAREVQVQAPAP
ncbi:MAG: hypothetical protein ACP5H2_10305, partial [Solirubrobacteraceae bacterium]